MYVPEALSPSGCSADMSPSTCGTGCDDIKQKRAADLERTDCGERSSNYWRRDGGSIRKDEGIGQSLN